MKFKINIGNFTEYRAEQSLELPSNDRQLIGWVQSTTGAPTLAAVIACTSASVPNGQCLDIDIAVTGTSSLFYAAEGGTVPFSKNVSNERGYTIEFQKKVVDVGSLGGQSVYWADDLYGEYILFYDTHIQLGVDTTTYVMDTTDDFHKYRVTAKGTEVKVYVDDTLRITGTLSQFAFDLSSAAISQYKFNDDAADTVVKDSQGAHDGTFFGGNTEDKSVAGKINEGFDFDGTDDYVQVPNHSDFDLGLGDKCLCAWINADVNPAFMAILNMGYRTIGSTGYNIGVNDYGKATHVSISNGVEQINVYKNSGTEIVVGTWYFVLYNIDRSANLDMWNGVGVEISTDISFLAASDIVSTGPFRVGVRTDLVNDFNGQIDNPIVFNRVLNESEIYALFNGGRGTEELSHKKLLYFGAVPTATSVSAQGGQSRWAYIKYSTEGAFKPNPDQDDGWLFEKFDLSDRRRTAEHGVIRSDNNILPANTMRPKKIRVSGTIAGSDWGSLRNATRRLQRLLREGTIRLQMDDERYIEGLHSNFSFNPVTQDYARFGASFDARYPFFQEDWAQYVSTAPVSNSTFYITNNGDIEVPAKVIVTGAASGTIDNDIDLQNVTLSQHAKFVAVLQQTSELVIDKGFDIYNTYKLEVGGAGSFGSYEGDLFTLQPGENAFVYTGGVVGTIEVYWREAYHL